MIWMMLRKITITKSTVLWEMLRLAVTAIRDLAAHRRSITTAAVILTLTVLWETLLSNLQNKEELI